MSLRLRPNGAGQDEEWTAPLPSSPAELEQLFASAAERVPGASLLFDEEGYECGWDILDPDELYYLAAAGESFTFTEVYRLRSALDDVLFCSAAAPAPALVGGGLRLTPAGVRFGIALVKKFSQPDKHAQLDAMVQRYLTSDSFDGRKTPLTVWEPVQEEAASALLARPPRPTAPPPSPGLSSHSCSPSSGTWSAPTRARKDFGPTRASLMPPWGSPSAPPPSCGGGASPHNNACRGSWRTRASRPVAPTARGSGRRPRTTRPTSPSPRTLTPRLRSMAREREMHRPPRCAIESERVYLRHGSGSHDIGHSVNNWRTCLYRFNVPIFNWEKYTAGYF
ncbi:hypothetical protein EMVG_00284 [Emiliania huxleyi virus PS401]|nr:hypothetical protein EMVG_00284 [Emiliania huxleyi virus PS401]